MPRLPILFVAENVTLAQIVRLVTLAAALPRSEFEVHFACSEFPDLVFAGTEFVRHSIETLDSARAAEALDAGKRLYEQRDLARYVDAETALIERVAPRLVVGDFRLSLSTSAELLGVPSAVLINAYWSPFAARERWPVPDHPILRLLGERLTAQYFPRAMPRVFEHFAAPLNAVRKRRGLPPVGSLLQMLTHGDFTLYPDDPWLTPVEGAPASHQFIGPVSWEPRVEPPPLDVAGGRPLVYATLGSSGKLDALPVVLEALAGLPVDGVVATAGRAQPDKCPGNVRVLPFVRGSELAKRAGVVISNGGSTTGYQALAAGTPVVGLPSNFDQYLAMQAIERVGAGITVKARQATVSAVRSAVEAALTDPAFTLSARRVAARFAAHDAPATFTALVRRIAAGGAARALGA